MGCDQDFRNCAWASTAKNEALKWRCKRKKLDFSIADLGIELCPCRDWIRRSTRPGKTEKKAEKGSQKSLF